MRIEAATPCMGYIEDSRNWKSTREKQWEANIGFTRKPVACRNAFTGESVQTSQEYPYLVSDLSCKGNYFTASESYVRAKFAKVTGSKNRAVYKPAKKSYMACFVPLKWSFHIQSELGYYEGNGTMTTGHGLGDFLIAEGSSFDEIDWDKVWVVQGVIFQHHYALNNFSDCVLKEPQSGVTTSEAEVSDRAEDVVRWKNDLSLFPETLSKGGLWAKFTGDTELFVKQYPMSFQDEPIFRDMISLFFNAIEEMSFEYVSRKVGYNHKGIFVSAEIGKSFELGMTYEPALGRFCTLYMLTPGKTGSEVLISREEILSAIMTQGKDAASCGASLRVLEVLRKLGKTITAVYNLHEELAKKELVNADSLYSQAADNCEVSNSIIYSVLPMLSKFNVELITEYGRNASELLSRAVQDDDKLIFSAKLFMQLCNEFFSCLVSKSERNKLAINFDNLYARAFVGSFNYYLDWYPAYGMIKMAVKHGYEVEQESILLSKRLLDLAYKMYRDNMDNAVGMAKASLVPFLNKCVEIYTDKGTEVAENTANTMDTRSIPGVLQDVSNSSGSAAKPSATVVVKEKFKVSAEVGVELTVDNIPKSVLENIEHPEELFSSNKQYSRGNGVVVRILESLRGAGVEAKLVHSGILAEIITNTCSSKEHYWNFVELYGFLCPYFFQSTYDVFGHRSGICSQLYFYNRRFGATAHEDKAGNVVVLKFAWSLSNPSNFYIEGSDMYGSFKKIVKLPICVSDTSQINGNNRLCGDIRSAVFDIYTSWSEWESKSKKGLSSAEMSFLNSEFAGVPQTLLDIMREIGLNSPEKIFSSDVRRLWANTLIASLLDSLDNVHICIYTPSKGTVAEDVTDACSDNSIRAAVPAWCDLCKVFFSSIYTGVKAYKAEGLSLGLFLRRVRFGASAVINGDLAIKIVWSLSDVNQVRIIGHLNSMKSKLSDVCLSLDSFTENEVEEAVKLAFDRWRDWKLRNRNLPAQGC